MTKSFSKRFSGVGKKIGRFFSRDGQMEYKPLVSGLGVLGYIIAFGLLFPIIFADWSLYDFALYNWEWAWMLPSGLIVAGVFMIIAHHRSRDCAGWIIAGVLLFIALYASGIFDAIFWGVRWAFGVK